MSENHSNQRRNHRFQVGDMGYEASIVIDAETDARLDCTVLDFSAMGIQVEVPHSVQVPKDGILTYNGQNFRYIIKHQRWGEQSKRLGLELNEIPADQLLNVIPAAKSEFIGDTTSDLSASSSIGRDALFWVATSVALCMVWAMFFQGSFTVYHREVDAFWAQMPGIKPTLPTEANPAKPAGQPLQVNAVPSHRTDTTIPSTGSIRLSYSTSKIVESIRRIFDRSTETIKPSDYEIALVKCNQVLLDHEDLGDAWRLRGVVLNRLARHAEAISDLRHSLALDAKAPMTYVELAQALCDIGNFDEAVEQIHLGLQFVQEEFRPHYDEFVEKFTAARDVYRSQHVEDTSTKIAGENESSDSTNHTQE